MRWLVLAMLVGCNDPTGLGTATASAYATAASATVTIANATDGVIGWRVWSIEIGEAEPGTDCKNRRDPLVAFDVFTQLSSAPRGVIRPTIDVPPVLFPAFYAHYSNGFAVDGELVIDAASSSGLFGSFRGTANLDGTVVTLDAAFEAPTCGI